MNRAAADPSVNRQRGRHKLNYEIAKSASNPREGFQLSLLRATLFEPASGNNFIHPWIG